MGGLGALAWAAAAVLALALGAAAGAPEGDALARAAERGTLRLGHRIDAPPFSYVDAEGRPVGLAVRLCEALAPEIAAEAGAALAVDWVAVPAAERFAALAEGRIDLLCGPTTQTLARREVVDFSIPWFVDGAGIVFRRGGPERLEELTTEAVGVLGGTTTEALARRLLGARAPGARVVAFADHGAGLAALERGEVEAYMADRSILAYQLGLLRPVTPLALSPRLWSREPYALAMARGESRLRLAVDRGLSRLYRSGAMVEMIEAALGRGPRGPELEAIHEVVAIPE